MFILDKCILCGLFFVRNAENNYTVRYDKMVNVLCSKNCQTHFILKHRSLVECQFCRDQNFNFYMMQAFSNRGANIDYFCSKTCLDLFREVEDGFDLDDSDVSEEKTVFVPVTVKDENYLVNATQSNALHINRSVAIQADMPCSCNKENDRTILKAIKPGKRSNFELKINNNNESIPPSKQQCMSHASNSANNGINSIQNESQSN